MRCRGVVYALAAFSLAALAASIALAYLGRALPSLMSLAAGLVALASLAYAYRSPTPEAEQTT
ncbi:MAG: hypothetical protein GXO32_01475 [Crenarchaeota archaeon]|nr:hypothetical protein [Thermoproteota archaeon]